ncbi:MAG TPA: hypothetical protein DG084_09855 [Gemmatimonadetes bacterium]|nr:hypothetical protein [Gemmatimonadota bacterium]
MIAAREDPWVVSPCNFLPQHLFAASFGSSNLIGSRGTVKKIYLGDHAWEDVLSLIFPGNLRVGYPAFCKTFHPSDSIFAGSSEVAAAGPASFRTSWETIK